jgi:glutathione S-transferase
MGSSGSTQRSFHTNPEAVIVHVVPASQYSTKVLAGLVQRNIPHFLEFVPGDPASRHLPSGGDMVPELEMGGVGTADSAAIFRFLDQCGLPQLANAPFFPNPDLVGQEVSDKVLLLERLAEQELDLFVMFFNFVDPEGHARSVRQSLARYIPWWAFWISIDDRLAEKRAEETAACRRYFLPQADATVALDRSLVLSAWQAMLRRLEGQFGAPESWTLCGTPYPTAADFAVFSKLARLQDQLGDVSIGAGLPDALTGFEADAPRLLAWYQRMRTDCPLVWRNKRVPTGNAAAAVPTNAK